MMHMRSWHYYRTVKKMRETSDDMRHKTRGKTTIENEQERDDHIVILLTGSVLCQEWDREGGDGIRGV
jgi:hypothetical protein